SALDGLATRRRARRDGRRTPLTPSPKRPWAKKLVVDNRQFRAHGSRARRGLIPMRKTALFAFLIAAACSKKSEDRAPSPQLTPMKSDEPVMVQSKPADPAPQAEAG